MAKDIFPLTIAEGYAFCNRTTQQKELYEHMDKSRAVVLLAPRRYGKSSLIHKVCNNWETDKNKLVTSTTLFHACDLQSTIDIIITAAHALLDKIIPTISTANMGRIFSQLKKLNITAKMDGASGWSYGLQISETQQTPESLTTLLKRLNDAAKKFNVQCCFVMDEFQQIATLKDHFPIEAAIREAVQNASNISYVFSGSNRNMLRLMFEDSARPFYHQCQKMMLDRISEKHYINHLQEIAKSKWGKESNLSLIKRIFELTERHPLYINYLCSKVWEGTRSPSLTDINHAWTSICKTEKNDVLLSMNKISTGQRSILIALAKKPESELFSQRFSTSVNMPQSSIQRASKQLEQDDLIYQGDMGQWRPLDPCLKTMVANKAYLHL